MIEKTEAGLRKQTAEPDQKPSPWSALIEKIQSNDAAGMEELFGVFSRGVRFHVSRRIGPEDLEEVVRDIFLMVTEAIRRGDVQEPGRLTAFVRGVVRRQLADRIGRTANSRRQPVEGDGATERRDQSQGPERTAIIGQRQVLARRVLSGVTERDLEVLVRFYLREQTREDICREMGLTESQFQQVKSRAKERFGALDRQ